MGILGCVAICGCDLGGKCKSFAYLVVCGLVVCGWRWRCLHAWSIGGLWRWPLGDSLRECFV